MLARSCLFLGLAALVGGCSALIDTDPDVFGESDVTLPDYGPPDMVDGGGPRDMGPGPVDMLLRPDMPPADCPAPPECAGGNSLVCQDGVRVTVPCPAGCNGATGECLPTATGFTPSNVGREQFREDGPDLDLDEAFRYDTNSCTSMTGASRVVSMRGGGEACVLSVGSFRLRESGFMQVGGARPLIIVANDEIRIEGIIDVSAREDQTGPAGQPGGRTVSGAENGQGPGGGEAGVHEEDFDDGGGGGAGGCGGGGDGGSGGAADGGEGGSPWLDGNDLQPLVGGSGGGRGRGAVRGTFSNAGEGGAGGGALQLTAANRIVISGGIVAGGGGGQGGRNGGDSGTNWGSGGGGGAGGNVIVEAPDISGAGGLSVVGGGGGGGSSSTGAGGAGQDGVDAATARPSGGDSGGFQYGADGGDGGGLAVPAGAGGGSNDSMFANGGGGGGGAGCVVVRSSGSPAVAVNPPGSVTNLSLLP